LLMAVRIQRTGRWGLVGLAAALACVAEAAELELEPDSPSVIVETELPPPELDLQMAELSLGSRPLEPARELVPAFAPSWRMPEHESGELPRWIRHATIPRETIEQLALRYGVRPDKLREWNGLGPDEQPHPRRSTTLRIFAQRNPAPREAVEHAVLAGEGWASIARRYGVDSNDLRAWNVGEVGRTLEPGELLTIWIDPLVFDSIVNDAPDDARAALVRPGAHGVGTPQAGALIAGVRIPPGPGYELRYANSAWGTTAAVREAVAALDRFVARSSYPLPIKVGTMSRQRGGEVGGHNSHQTGRDLDIRLPLREEVPQGLAPTARRVDWATAWALVEAFAESEAVEVIFLDYRAQRRLHEAARAAGADEQTLAATLQYPRGSKASSGLIRHAPGHEGHLHVRFACGPAEPECG
jgi:murein endopeptidase